MSPQRATAADYAQAITPEGRPLSLEEVMACIMFGLTLEEITQQHLIKARSVVQRMNRGARYAA